MRHYKEVIRVERTITLVKSGLPMHFKRKRVAAYTRVSTAKDAMLHSLSAQVSYFSDLIQRNPEWEYVGVYSDEGISGTKENRAAFQQMVDDCRAGKVDMIITKSLSRFARNTVTLLKIVRELRDLGVDVYFEKENIHSMNGDGELMLTILASFAQEESRSVSENCKWRIRQDFKQGLAKCWSFMYGYHIKNGVVTINEKEAAVVRWVFHEYTNGAGTTELARLMRYTNVPSAFGGEWTPMRLIHLLKNEKYAGNMLLQKRFCDDHLTKHFRPNRGELPQYFVEGSHPAIIDQETFDKAQEIMRRNWDRQLKFTETVERYPFTQMIVCDKCGKHYQRKASRTGAGWNCYTYLTRGKGACHTKRIPEEILYKETTQVLGLVDFDPQVFADRVKEIRVPDFNKLVFVFKDGHTEERQWDDLNRSRAWTPEMRAQAATHARRRHQ